MNLKSHKDKFEPRSTPHVFIGYPFNTKGYKVLNLSSGRINVSKDVVFHENIFSFALTFPDSSINSVLKKLTLLNSNHSIFNDDYVLRSDVINNVTCDFDPRPLSNFDTISISGARSPNTIEPYVLEPIETQNLTDTT